MMNFDETEEKRRIITFGDLPLSPGVQGYMNLKDIFGGRELQRPESFDGDQSQETALICYSSGTTSKPKGVEVSHII